MAPKKGRGGMTPTGQILPGLEGLEEYKPLLTGRKTAAPKTTSKELTHQARHHYTRADQINALISIGEDPNPDIGFMTRLLTLCSLPRTDPGNKLQFVRQNGPYKLAMLAGADNKLPYGNIPRLLLAWVCSEAVKTREPRLNLGNSLSEFMEKVGITTTREGKQKTITDGGGSRGNRTRLKTQIDRLFNCHIDLVYQDRGTKISTGGRLAPKSVLWWDYKNPDQEALWKSWIQLGEELFEEIIKHPVPINTEILSKMRRSSLGLDLYLWLSYKTFTLYSKGGRPEQLTWERLYLQFGANPELASDKTTVQNFRKDVRRELLKLKRAWPALSYDTPKGCLEIRPCPPSIPTKETKQIPARPLASCRLWKSLWIREVFPAETPHLRWQAQPNRPLKHHTCE